jgi:hypothetical protein
MCSDYAHVRCLLAAGFVFKVLFSSFDRNFSISDVALSLTDTDCEISTTSELRFRRSFGLLQKPAYTNNRLAYTRPPDGLGEGASCENEICRIVARLYS